MIALAPANAAQLCQAKGMPDAMPCGVGPHSAACWGVDLSAVGALIDIVASKGDWPDWVAALLHGARIADVNERGLELVGSPVGREAMVGQPVASFCPPDSWTVLAELIVAVAADRPNHSVRSKAINSFMFRGAVLSVWGAPNHAISYKVWVAVDGELADDRSFWAVKASEQRYRRLIHHLPFALVQVDSRAANTIFYDLRSEGITDLASHLATHGDLVEAACHAVRVTDANHGAVQLFGAASVEQLMAPVDYVFAAAPETVRRVMIAHFDGRRNHGELMKVRTFDGRTIDVRLSVTFPTPPERLDVTLLTFEDVTDKLRMEAQLRQLQADYSRAARIATLGELASSIAHEVNQPLAAIAMNAETSLRWLSRDEPNLEKARQLTARIGDSARHASEIVHRIRGMAGRHLPEPALLDLNDIVAEALLFVRHDIDTRAIGLSADLARRLPHVLADRVQMQQVVVNLLVNSLQAIAMAGNSAGQIEVATEAEADGAVVFWVRDNGPGIAEADLDRVFDSFYTTKNDGMGIGLAVCQSIIVAHGGRIAASNHPGGGALLRFALPAATEV